MLLFTLLKKPNFPSKTKTPDLVGRGASEKRKTLSTKWYRYKQYECTGTGDARLCLFFSPVTPLHHTRGGTPPPVCNTTPSSILAGMPPPNPWDAAASIRAIFAAWESALTPCGDRLSIDGNPLGGIRDSLAAIAVGRAGDPDCLSLWFDVRGETLPFWTRRVGQLIVQWR